MAVKWDSPAAYIMIYTRRVEEKTYPAGLAGSLHLAVSRDGRTYRALNQNYGVLFVRGVVQADNTICPLRAGSRSMGQATWQRPQWMHFRSSQRRRIGLRWLPMPYNAPSGQKYRQKGR